MKIEIYTGGAVQTNGYLISSDDSCFVIDAPAGIAEAIKESGRTPSHLLLTHQHFDHVEDAAALQAVGCHVIAHSEMNRDLIRDDFAQSAGLDVSVPDFTVDEIITEGELTVGSLTCQVSHIPGHSPDSISFYFAEHDSAISGDTLFSGSIGRTDLPGGSHETLLKRIREALFTLPENTLIFPGHGPKTTVGQEIATNPYLR